MQVEQCTEEGTVCHNGEYFILDGSYIAKWQGYLSYFLRFKFFFSILGVVIYVNFETYHDTFEGPEFPRLNQNISKFQEHEEFTS